MGSSASNHAGDPGQPGRFSPAEAAFLRGLTVGDERPGEPRPPSPFERLLQAVETHARSEAASLDEYQRLVDQGEDPVTTLLLGLVLQDEQRHHELLKSMVASLEDALQWTTSPEALPLAAPARQAAAPALAAATRARIREERESARHFRQLARAERHLADGLFSLLLEVMAMDSDKHAHLLRFILRRLESRA